MLLRDVITIYRQPVFTESGIAVVNISGKHLLVNGEVTYALTDDPLKKGHRVLLVRGKNGRKYIPGGSKRCAVDCTNAMQSTPLRGTSYCT